MFKAEEECTATPWSNVYGLARTLIALSTMATLLVNDTSILWIPAAGIPDAPICGTPGPVPNLFCLDPTQLRLAKWVAIAVLAVAASGWRPRFTGVLHWWVTHSFVSSALLVDGGDQLSSTLTLLLVPLTLSDGRTWHWQAAPTWPKTVRGSLRAGLGAFTLWILRLQVAVVYLNAAASKWGEQEWSDGTALYYWFADPAFGFTPALHAWVGPLMHNPFIVSTMTWGVIAFEFALFGGLFLRDRLPRHILLVMGLTFHAGIAVVHGLPSFVLIMYGALILLFRREDEPFAFGAVAKSIGALVRRTRAIRENSRNGSRPAAATVVEAGSSHAGTGPCSPGAYVVTSVAP